MVGAFEFCFWKTNGIWQLSDTRHFTSTFSPFISTFPSVVSVLIGWNKIQLQLSQIPAFLFPLCSFTHTFYLNNNTLSLAPHSLKFIHFLFSFKSTFETCNIFCFQLFLLHHKLSPFWPLFTQPTCFTIESMSHYLIILTIDSFSLQTNLTAQWNTEAIFA